MAALPQIAPNPLGEGSVTFVDRVHVYKDVPAFILGADYIMLANDNKGQAIYELDVTLSKPATLYVFVDNRMGGAAGGKGVAPNITGMPWLTSMGFVDTGEDIGIDESADGSINQYFSIFALDVKPGIVTSRGNTQGHAGNMLGVAALPRGDDSKAHSPVPEDRATDVPKDVVLGWTPGEFAQRHNVYLGTVFADVNNASVAQPRDVLVSQGQTGTTYDPATDFTYGTTYYWRVDEVNAPPSSTIFKGDVWSFTVEPYAYPVKPTKATASSAQADMGPEKTIDGSGLNAVDQHSTEPEDMWLSAGVQPNWIQYEFDKAYKLHELWIWNSNQLIEPFIGFGAKGVKVEYSLDGTTWTEVAGVPEFARGEGLPTYTANTTVSLGGVAAKYVKLTILNSWGVAPPTGLSEVRFFSVPVQALAPQPVVQGTGVSIEPTLTWRPGREAASHTVYFGADQAAVANATVAGQTMTETRYSPGVLNYGTTYYWRVDEVGTVTYPGDLWSFTTAAYGVVDDFESYTDKAGQEVWSAWSDGFDNPTRNGAEVGLATAVNGTFCDTTIFRGGKASMPLAYNNTTAPLSEATLTLAPAQDWTASGVQSLVLYFRGAAGNGGQLYVKINNSKVPYPGSAGDLASAAWQLWSIDLSAVAGVNKVTTLTIGIEGAGAKGALHIDDIRLSPARLVPLTQLAITKVVRANGQPGTRTDASPVREYTGGTAPAAMPIYGLMDGAFVFSDRVFTWTNTPPALVGAEYILGFNQDKSAGETDVTYTVTLGRAATVFIGSDDRFRPNQQATVDAAVAAFAKPGQFKDTGLKLYYHDGTNLLSVSVFTADLPAGTYVFGAQVGNCFYTIGVMPK